jgi:hypothetical protein
MKINKKTVKDFDFFYDYNLIMIVLLSKKMFYNE